MLRAPNLGIPDVKPAIESIRGRWVQKVSPKTIHSLLQGRVWKLLAAWAGGQGYVGPEWRFYLLPAGEKPSSLVPDVAYVSRERLPREGGKLPEKPTIAPDIAVEIISPDERRRALREKIGLYLANGARVVIAIDPQKRTVTINEPGCDPLVFGANTIAESQAFPDLRLDLAELFADF